MGESLISHLRTWFNISDILTNKVTSGAKCHRLIGNVLYDIYDDHDWHLDQQDQPVNLGLRADLERTEEICPCGGSNSPALGVRNVN